MAEYPEKSKSAVVGFGLTVDRKDIATFCWEWFDLDGPEHATKLQEQGELRIRTAQIGQVWEVVNTEFLSDASFRVARFGIDDPVSKPKWRVVIEKGSVIQWPSVLDGKIILR
mgnify:CR=1 FL=1